MCAQRLGRGGQGGCGRLGASGPGARRRDGCHGDRPAPAPRARTRIVSVGSLLFARRCAAGGLWKDACVWTSLNHSDRSRLLAPRRGAREPGSRLWVTGVRTWFYHSSGSRGLLVAISRKACRRKARTRPRAAKNRCPSTRGSLRSPSGLHRPVLFILQICGKGEARVGIRDITEPVTRPSSK